MIDISEIAIEPTYTEKSKHYTIPENVDRRIKSEFYDSMHMELLRIYGIERITKIYPVSCSGEDGYYDLRSSSPEWRAAFYNACYMTRSLWLYIYWDGLDWSSQDDFDSILEERIIERYATQ